MTTTAVIMLAALAIEACFGWPDKLYNTIRHPVVWIGNLINLLDRRWNQEAAGPVKRWQLGIAATVLAVAAAASTAAVVSHALSGSVLGLVVSAFVASSLFASRSLYQHVSAVLPPLQDGDLAAARDAVSKIVGRDPNQLDQPALARASIESLAENASDGVIAPLFWGVLLGLPGLAAYKAINTLDSMIGHRTEQHQDFGAFAARLDDIANLIPARLTGVLIAAVSRKPQAFSVMWRDARKHRSPNAGWPESAMAGALGVRLSGPRKYETTTSDEPWLNENARDPKAVDIARALRLFVLSTLLAAAAVVAVALIFWLGTA